MSRLRPDRLGLGVEFRVEAGIPAGGTAAVWGPITGNALWNESQWFTDSTQWVELSQLTLAVSTSRGRDQWENRFRTGTAQLLLDNTQGLFSQDSGSASPIRLRPGRYFRLSGRIAPELERVVEFPDTSGETHLISSTVPVAGIGTGDLRFTARLSFDELPSTGQQKIIDMLNSGTLSGANIALESTGRVSCSWYSGGASTNLAQSVGLLQDFVDAGRVFDLDVFLQTDDGTGSRLVTFSVSTDQGRTWELLGPPVPGPATSTVPPTQNLWLGRLGQNLLTGQVVAGSQLVAHFDAGDIPREPGILPAGFEWDDPDTPVRWRILGSEMNLTEYLVGSDWEPLFVGQVDSIEDVYGAGAEAPNSRWLILDGFARLQIDNPPALDTPVGGGELTSTRVGRLAADADFPFPVLLQPGEHTMLASTLANSILEEMQTAADAEGGGLFIGRDGTLYFKARDWLLEDPRSAVVQWSAGAPGDDVQILDASTDWSTARVLNDIQFARREGTAVRVQSEVSQLLYGRRSYQRFDLENDNDSDVGELANRFLTFFQWDRTRLEQVEVTPLTRSAAQELLELELGDRIRLRVSTLPGWSFTAEYWVNRIEHVVTADDWRVLLRVDTTDFSPPRLRGGFDEDAYDEGYAIGGG